MSSEGVTENLEVKDSVAEISIEMIDGAEVVEGTAETQQEVEAVLGEAEMAETEENRLGWKYGKNKLDGEEMVEVRDILLRPPSVESFHKLVSIFIDGGLEEGVYLHVESHINEWPDEVRAWPIELNEMVIEGSHDRVLSWIRVLDLSDDMEFKDLKNLKLVANLASLDLSGCANLEELDLNCLKNLRHLDLNQCWNLQNFDGLSKLKKLSFLGLYSCSGFTDLSVLSELKELEVLDLRTSGVESFQDFPFLEKLTTLGGTIDDEDLIPLSILKNLRSLALSGSTFLVDVDGLSSLENLMDVDLSCCSSLKNIDGLSNSKNLYCLSLESCGALLDIEGLRLLTKLQSLNLAYCPKLECIDPLAGFDKLNSLNLHSFEGLDFRVLSGLMGLKKLDLTFCNKFDDLSLIAAVNMEELILFGCDHIENMDVLSNLKNLISLNLYGCRGFSSLSFLEGLDKLTHLDLSVNRRLSSFSALSGLTKLVNLKLAECSQFSELEVLMELDKLEVLDISCCVGIDLSDENTVKQLDCLRERLGNWLLVSNEGVISHYRGLMGRASMVV